MATWAGIMDQAAMQKGSDYMGSTWARCRVVAVWTWIAFVLSTAGVAVLAQDWRIDDHSRRISELERIRGDARISVLENRIDRLEALVYGVGIVAVGQLVLSGLAYRNSSSRNGQ